MKRTFKLSVLLAFVLTTFTVMGREPKVTIDEGKKSIFIELAKSAFVYEIQFIGMENDSKNNVIYSERIYKNQMLDKELDLAALPVGDYLLEVENYLLKTKYLFTVETSKVSIVSKEVVNKPIFIERNEKVYLTLINTDLTPVEITVRDAFDNLLFSETIKETLDVQKAFNFTKAFQGSYTIQVKDGSTTYSEKVEIR